MFGLVNENSTIVTRHSRSGRGLLFSNRRDGRAHPSLGVAAAALVMTVSAFAPSVASAAGILSCQKLEQNCEAYVSHMTQALQRTRSDQVGQPSARDLSVQRCQEQYASAEQTGIWPARGATPALPCTKN
jgi:hypothetical protein